MQQKNGYVLLHRVIIENRLGRVLNANEVVHHKDHNKRNNVVENLEVMDRKQHNVLHGLEHGRKMLKLRCPWCGKVFERFKNQTHLQKHSKYNCTCCCKSCSVRLCHEIRLRGLTPTLESAISENILAEYVMYTDEDNSEETNL